MMQMMSGLINFLTAVSKQKRENIEWKKGKFIKSVRLPLTRVEIIFMDKNILKLKFFVLVEFGRGFRMSFVFE